MYPAPQNMPGEMFADWYNFNANKSVRPGTEDGSASQPLHILGEPDTPRFMQK
jgi:hypothetical protein